MLSAAHGCLYLSVTVFPSAWKMGQSIIKGLLDDLVVPKANQAFPSSSLEELSKKSEFLQL